MPSPIYRASNSDQFSEAWRSILAIHKIEQSRATYRKMIQNLVWATAYNLVAIPVAAGLFVRWGFDLPMSVGAVAMSLSTIIVAANAQLLCRLKLQRVAL